LQFSVEEGDAAWPRREEREKWAQGGAQVNGGEGKKKKNKKGKRGERLLVRQGDSGSGRRWWRWGNGAGRGSVATEWARVRERDVRVREGRK